MGNRPYYILYVVKDCDGYESWIEYLGVNWKAAFDRYRDLIQMIKQEYFINDGINDEDIEINFRGSDRPLDIGNEICTSINDNDCCWMSVCLKCVCTGSFLNPRHEQEYKVQHPNAKY